MSVFVDIEKKLGSFHLRATFEADDEVLALLGARMWEEHDALNALLALLSLIAQDCRRRRGPL